MDINLNGNTLTNGYFAGIVTGPTLDNVTAPNFGVQQAAGGGLHIVCIGDSIVDGSVIGQVGNITYSWPYLLQNMGAGNGNLVYNLGLIGDTETGIASIFNSNVHYTPPSPMPNGGTYSPTSLYHAPGDILIDQGGTNDISQIAGWYNPVTPTGSSNGTSVVTVSSTSGINTGVYIQSVSWSTFTNDGTNVSDGATVTLGNIIYRFKSTMTQAYDVQIGANAAATVANLILAINATGTAGTNYFAGTLANSYGTAGAISGTTFPVLASIRGHEGDAVATTVSGSHISWTGSTLSGGSVIPFGTTVTAVGTGNVTVSNVVPTNAALKLSVAVETFAQFQNACMSIWSAARALGYKIYRLNILPRAIPNVDNSLVQAVLAQMNAWLLSQKGIGYDYYIDIASVLPNASDLNTYGAPGGLHPNVQGLQIYAAVVNAALMQNLGADYAIFPFTAGGIKNIWLPPDVPLTDAASTQWASETTVAFGVLGQSGGAVVNVNDTINLTGSNFGSASPSFNIYQAFGAGAAQFNWYASQYTGPGTGGSPVFTMGVVNGGIFQIDDPTNGGGLYIPAAPFTNGIRLDCTTLNINGQTFGATPIGISFNQTGSSQAYVRNPQWQENFSNGDSNWKITDRTNTVDQLVVTPGTGTTGGITVPGSIKNTSLAASSLVKTDSSKNLVSAVAGTDYANVGVTTLTPTGPSPTVTINFALGNYFVVNLSGATGTVVIAFSTAVAGSSCVIEMVQGATTVPCTFPANTIQAGGGGTTYTPSGSGHTDLITVTLKDATHARIAVTNNYA